MVRPSYSIRSIAWVGKISDDVFPDPGPLSGDQNTWPISGGSKH